MTQIHRWLVVSDGGAIGQRYDRLVFADRTTGQLTITTWSLRKHTHRGRLSVGGGTGNASEPVGGGGGGDGGGGDNDEDRGGDKSRDIGGERGSREDADVSWVPRQLKLRVAEANNTGKPTSGDLLKFIEKAWMKKNLRIASIHVGSRKLLRFYSFKY